MRGMQFAAFSLLPRRIQFEEPALTRSWLRNCCHTRPIDEPKGDLPPYAGNISRCGNGQDQQCLAGTTSVRRTNTTGPACPKFVPKALTLGRANVLGSHPPEHHRSGAAPTRSVINVTTTRQGLHAVLLCLSLRVGSDSRTRLTRRCSDRGPVSLSSIRLRNPSLGKSWDFGKTSMQTHGKKGTIPSG
jgi:hypothetical protein